MTIGKKLITVFGGTGNQGSAVVRSLLSHRDQIFQVRVITRDSGSLKAQALAGLGAELVVVADAQDRGQTIAAFQGSWGAFINSNSDAPLDPETLDAPNVYDLEVGLLEAAEMAGVQHVVYSSAGNTHRATKGRIHIPGFDCKSLVEEHTRAHRHFTTFTPVLPASFMECWTDESFCRLFGGFPWYQDSQREVVLAVPPYGGDGRMPWVSLQDDFGDIVHGIFLYPFRYNGRRVQAISQMIRFEDLAAEFTGATGTPVRYQPLQSWKEIPDDGSHLCHDSRQMFFYMNFCGGRWYAEYATDITMAEECKRAARQAQDDSDGKLVTFKEWFTREAANPH